MWFTLTVSGKVTSSLFIEGQSDKPAFLKEEVASETVKVNNITQPMSD